MNSKTRPTSFLSSAQEAILLLLLATGWRVDDAWKLSGRVDVSSEGITVFFQEKRKCKVKGSHTLSRVIPRFQGSKRVCPVEAVLLFFNLAKKRRKTNKFLSVSSLGMRASKDTLRRWVRDLLLQCGISASAGSCRSAATSSALERNWPIDKIMSSAGWSSENTFRKFYERNVLPTVGSLNLLNAK